AGRVLETLVRSRDGSLWIGTSSGLVRLEGGAATLFTEKEGLPGGAVLSLVEDARGTLLIGTAKGLARYPDGPIASEADARARRLVRPLLADREGSLWFASRSSESVLVRLREQKIWTLGAADDVPVHCVLEAPSGDVWVGTDEGLDRVGPGGKAHFST